jgi:hypothetical protein
MILARGSPASSLAEVDLPVQPGFTTPTRLVNEFRAEHAPQGGHPACPRSRTTAQGSAKAIARFDQDRACRNSMEEARAIPLA